MSETEIPQSPEEQPPHVREALDQVEISHRGDRREGAEPGQDADAHLGAVEDEVVPVTPPMDGPATLIEGEEAEDGIEPSEELHGG